MIGEAGGGATGRHLEAACLVLGSQGCTLTRSLHPPRLPRRLPSLAPARGAAFPAFPAEPRGPAARAAPPAGAARAPARTRQPPGARCDVMLFFHTRGLNTDGNCCHVLEMSPVI